MLSTSIKLALLAVLVFRLSVGSAYAAPHGIRRSDHDESMNVRSTLSTHESTLDTRQITGIIDAITGAGEAGSDAAKVAKGGSGASKASKSTKAEAKDQNKGNSTSQQHEVVNIGMDIRGISDTAYDERS
ncbi:hypothetical protein F5877DRAFT_62916 [Lentinula edodes]|nr:hypothetical protein F5877DRAFT_62916 [Lentinula edodes]